MTISRLPAKRPASAEEFVDGAPDAPKQRVTKGRRVQITLTLPPDLLAAYDRLSETTGVSRASHMILALRRFVAEP